MKDMPEPVLLDSPLMDMPAHNPLGPGHPFFNEDMTRMPSFGQDLPIFMPS